jgi:hypothetical protein
MNYILINASAALTQVSLLSGESYANFGLFVAFLIPFFLVDFTFICTAYLWK